MPTATEPRGRRVIGTRIVLGLVIATALALALRQAGDAVQEAVAAIADASRGPPTSPTGGSPRCWPDRSSPPSAPGRCSAARPGCSCGGVARSPHCTRPPPGGSAGACCTGSTRSTGSIGSATRPPSCWPDRSPSSSRPSGFAPTPGGVGIVETGLTAALVAAGAGEIDALAGVLLTRAFTYAVPIGLGAIAVVGWRLRRRSDPDRSATEPRQLVPEAAG